MIDGDSLHRRAFVRHYFAITGWLVPTAILAFLPKCPACLAAYIAIAAGVGLSASTAKYLRVLLILSSVLCILYVARRQLLAVAWLKSHINRSNWSGRHLLSQPKSQQVQDLISRSLTSRADIRTL
jgi:hypothetical protein